MSVVAKALRVVAQLCYSVIKRRAEIFDLPCVPYALEGVDGGNLPLAIVLTGGQRNLAKQWSGIAPRYEKLAITYRSAGVP